MPGKRKYDKVMADVAAGKDAVYIEKTYGIGQDNYPELKAYYLKSKTPGYDASDLSLYPTIAALKTEPDEGDITPKQQAKQAKTETKDMDYGQLEKTVGETMIGKTSMAVWSMVPGLGGTVAALKQFKDLQNYKQSAQHKAFEVTQNLEKADVRDLMYLAETAPKVYDQVKMTYAPTLPKATPAELAKVLQTELPQRKKAAMVDHYQNQLTEKVTSLAQLGFEIDPERMTDMGYYSQFKQNLDAQKQAAIAKLNEDYPEKNHMVFGGNMSGTAGGTVSGRGTEYTKKLKELEATFNEINGNLGDVATWAMAKANPNAHPREIGKAYLSVVNPDALAQNDAANGGSENVKAQLEMAGLRAMMASGNPQKVTEATELIKTFNDRYPGQKRAEVLHRLSAEINRDNHWWGQFSAPTTADLDKASDQLSSADREFYKQHVRGWYDRRINTMFTPGLPQIGASKLAENLAIPFLSAGESFSTAFQRTNADNAALAMDADINDPGRQALGEYQPGKTRMESLVKKEASGAALTSEERYELDDLKTYIGVRGTARKIADDMFSVTGNVLGFVGLSSAIAAPLTLLGRAAGIMAPTAAVTAKGVSGIADTAMSFGVTANQVQAVSTFLGGAVQAYPQAAQQSIIMFPNDPGKRRLYTMGLTAAQAMSEFIFNDRKAVEAFMPNLAPRVYALASALGTKKMTQEAFTTQLAKVFKDAAKIAAGTAKNTSLEYAEELAPIAADAIMVSVMAPEKFDEENYWNQVKETTSMMLLGGIPAGLMAGVRDWRMNRIGIPELVSIGKNPDLAFKVGNTIDAMVKSGEITPAEAREKKIWISRIQDAVKGTGMMIEAGIGGGPKGDQPVRERQANKYAVLLANENGLRDKADATTDVVAKKKIEEQIRESEQLREDILTGTVYVDEDYGIVTPEEAAQNAAIEQAEAISQANTVINAASNIGDELSAALNTQETDDAEEDGQTDKPLFSYGEANGVHYVYDKKGRPVSVFLSKAEADNDLSIRLKKSTPDTQVTATNYNKARQEGKLTVDGVTYTRQEDSPIPVTGKTQVTKFSDTVSQETTIAVVEADELQAAHTTTGQRNYSHFIAEGQPKERTDAVSQSASDNIANAPNFDEITQGVSAYTGAPVVNGRREVIQGNNRVTGLKKHYQRGGATYKQALIERAAEFGLDPAQVAAMKNPVLVRVAKVDDAKAIELGNYDVKDTETGGNRRVDPVAASRKIPMREKLAVVRNLITDAALTLKANIRANWKSVQKLLVPNYVSPAQLNSMLDSDGELKPQAIDDIHELVKYFLFEGGDVRLPSLFEQLPNTVQQGIFKSLPSIFNVPADAGILAEIQNAAILLYNMQASKTESVQAYMRQYDMMDPDKQSKYSPADVALAEKLLAAQTEREIRTLFRDYESLVNGETNMFEQRPGVSKQEAVKQLLGVAPVPDAANVLHSTSKIIQDEQSGNASVQNDPSAAAGTDTASGTEDKGTGQAEPGESETNDAGTGQSEGVQGNPDVSGQPDLWAAFAADEDANIMADSDGGTITPMDPNSPNARMLVRAINKLFSKVPRFKGVKVLDVDAFADALDAISGKGTFAKADGTVYGFESKGVIYLNAAAFNMNTPVHEAGHIFFRWAKHNAPAIYKAGLEKARKSRYYGQVKSNPNYAGKSEIVVAEEALMWAVGDYGNMLSQQEKNAFKEWWNNLIEAIDRFIKTAKIDTAEKAKAWAHGYSLAPVKPKTIGQMTEDEIMNLSFDQLAYLMAERILEGKALPGGDIVYEWEKNAPSRDTSTVKEIEAKTIAFVQENKERLVDAWVAANGNLIDPDAIRELFGPNQLGAKKKSDNHWKGANVDMGYTGVWVLPYKAAGDLMVDAIWEWHQKNNPNKTIIAFTGNPGAGKGNFSRNNENFLSTFGVIYDAALSGYNSLAGEVIAPAIKHGFTPTVVQVYNDPATSFSNTIKRGSGSGRFVPIGFFISAYEKAIGKAQKVMENYPDVDYRGENNSNNAGNGAADASREETAGWSYRFTTDHVLKILENVNNEINSGGLEVHQVAAVLDGLSEAERLFTLGDDAGKFRSFQDAITRIERSIQSKNNGRNGRGGNSSRVRGEIRLMAGGAGQASMFGSEDTNEPSPISAAQKDAARVLLQSYFNRGIYKLEDIEADGRKKLGRKFETYRMALRDAFGKYQPNANSQSKSVPPQQNGGSNAGGQSGSIGNTTGNGRPVERNTGRQTGEVQGTSGLEGSQGSNVGGLSQLPGQDAGTNRQRVQGGRGGRNSMAGTMPGLWDQVSNVPADTPNTKTEIFASGRSFTYVGNNSNGKRVYQDAAGVRAYEPSAGIFKVEPPVTAGGLFSIADAREKDFIIEGDAQPGQKNSNTNSKPKTEKPPSSSDGPAGFRFADDYKGETTFNKRYRFDDNIAALELLHKLEIERRPATAEEQAILSRYVGWGGLKQILLNPDRDAEWDAVKSDQPLREYVRRAQAAINQLDPDGSKGYMKQARMSINNAHYTSIPVIRGIYAGLQKAGFNGGNILEPSAGIGNFIAAMPESLFNSSKTTAVELDPLTGMILKHLQQRTDVHITGFENAPLQGGAYDLVISNVPFGDFGVVDASFKKHADKRYRKAAQSIHNYFVVKGIESARPGGLVAVITSRYTMDSTENVDIRRLISDNAEFLGAIRLPGTAFAANAGTEVVTDVIFLRRLNEGETPSINDDFIKVRPKSVDGVDVKFNQYFHARPEQMLGTVVAGGLYSDSEFFLEGDRNADIQKQIEEAAGRIFPKPIYLDQQLRKNKKITTQANNWISKNEYERIGNLAITPDGSVVKVLPEYYVDPELDKKANDLGVDPDKIRDGRTNWYEEDLLERNGLRPSDFRKQGVKLLRYGKDRKAIAEALIQMRKAVNALLYSEMHNNADTIVDGLRSALRQEYQKFYSKFGRISDKKNKNYKDIQGVLEDESDRYTIEALEKNKDGQIVASDILEKRTIKAFKQVDHVDTLPEAILASYQELGTVDMQYMGRLLNKDPEVILDEESQKERPLLFRDTDGKTVSRDEYLSGNVRQKLLNAVAAAEKDIRFEVNVRQLQEVQPEDVPANKIYAPLGARWIPQEYFSQFVAATWPGLNLSISYDRVKSNWNVRVTGDNADSQAYQTKRKSFEWVFDKAINNEIAKVTYTVKEGTETKTYPDEQDTELAKRQVTKIREMFDKWKFQGDERRQRIQRIFNDTYNNTILRNYDGSHLHFPGLMGFDPRSHQKDVVWRMLQTGGGIMDHEVGSGKTLAMAVLAAEGKRLGFFNKPLIVGLKAQLGQGYRSTKKAYPNMNILMPKANEFDAKNRKRLLQQIATNDWDLVMLTHDQFNMLKQDADIQADIIRDIMKELESQLAEATTKQDKKNLENRIEKYKDKIASLLDSKKDADVFGFNELGLDFMMVDESQEFKNLEFATKHTQIRGLGNPTGSKRAFNMLVAARTIQKKWGKDFGILFASGTPISNSISEMYTLFRYLRPTMLKEQGIETLDDWLDVFAEYSTDHELYMGKFKEVTRLRQFVNLPELITQYRAMADVRNRHNMKLDRPEAEHHLIKVQPSESQNRYMEMLLDFIKTKGVANAQELKLTNGFDDEKGMNPAYAAMASTFAKKLSMDPRLIASGNQAGSKIAAAVDNIAKIYHDTAADKGVQLVFSDIGTPKAKNPTLALYNYLESIDTPQGILDAIFGEGYSETGKTIKMDDLRAKMMDEMQLDETDASALISESSSADVFDVYNEVKSQLIAQGVKPEEIEFIHDHDGDKKRKALYERVNAGEVRVLMGSTKKLGTGVNVQQKALAAHHLDIQWRPSDMEQRNGRVERQNNKLAKEKYGNKVQIYYYATERLMDASMYEMVGRKGMFVQQVKLGNVTSRSTEDLEFSMDVMSMAAELSGDPLFKEVADLRKKLRSLELEYGSWQEEQYRLRDQIDSQRRVLAVADEKIPQAKQALDYFESLPKEVDKDGKEGGVAFFATVGGETVEKVGDAGAKIVGATGTAIMSRPIDSTFPLATYYGKFQVMGTLVSMFDITTKKDERSVIGRVIFSDNGLMLGDKFTVSGHGVSAGTQPKNIITNLAAYVENYEAIRQRATDRIASYQGRVQTAFQKMDEYQAAEKALTEKEDILKAKADAEENARSAGRKEYDKEDGEDVNLMAGYAPTTIEQRETKRMLDEAKAELQAARSAYDRKRGELMKGYRQSIVDLFGQTPEQRGSQQMLFDERPQLAAAEKAIAPFKARVDRAAEAVNQLVKKYSDLEGKPTAQLAMFMAGGENFSNFEKIKEHARAVIAGSVRIERLPQEDERGRIEAGARMVEATLISAGDESTDRSSERREIQERSLEEYARVEGIWYEPNDGRLGTEVDRGGEATVYGNRPGYVAKVIDTYYSADPADFFDRVAIHNHLFPNTKYKLLGFSRSDYGAFQVVVEQPYIVHQRKATTGEIRTVLKNAGFDHVRRDDYKNADYILEDITEDNVLVDKNGTFYFIDTRASLADADVNLMAGKANPNQLDLFNNQPTRHEEEIPTGEKGKAEKVQFENIAANPVYSGGAGLLPAGKREGQPGRSTRDVDSVNTLKHQWRENRHIDFTGSTKIRDASDVAHIMRALENKSVEHAFAVHVLKDGTPIVQWIGTGSANATIFDPRAVLNGAMQFGSERIYLVHNHPSGNLRPSNADLGMTRKIRDMFVPLGIDIHHVIMDTFDEAYTVLNKENDYSSWDTYSRKDDKAKAPIKTLSLDSFSALREPISKNVQTADDIAGLMYQQRFSVLPKRGMLVLNHRLYVIANFLIPGEGDMETHVLRNLAKVPTATGIILYGNQPYLDVMGKVAKVRSTLVSGDFTVYDYVAVAAEKTGEAYTVTAADSNAHLIVRDLENKYQTNRLSDVNLMAGNAKEWPASFPDVAVHTTIAKLKSMPGYAAAKAGDEVAALDLVLQVVKPEKIDEIVRQYPNAVIAPVLAVEKSGHNKLADAFAKIFASETGREPASIFQTNRVGYTGASAIHRLFAVPEFDGEVTKGAEYIILDDVATSGSTLRGLKEYIESNGGKVVMATTLAASSNAQTGYGGYLAVKPGTAEKLVAKFGEKEINDLLRTYGIAESIRHLSNGQAAYLAAFGSIDAIRAKILEGGYSSIPGVLQEPGGEDIESLGSQEEGDQGVNLMAGTAQTTPNFSKATQVASGMIQNGVPASTVEAQLAGMVGPEMAANVASRAKRLAAAAPATTGTNQTVEQQMQANERSAWEQAKRKWEQLFTSTEGQEPFFKELSDYARGESQWIMRRAQQFVKRKLSPAFAKMTADQKDGFMERIYDLQSSTAKTATLTQDMAALATEYRQQIDQLTQEFVVNGWVAPGRAQTFLANMGKYLNRSYRIFNEHDWVKNIPQQAKNDAANLFKEDYIQQGLPDDQAEVMGWKALNDYLASAAADAHGFKALAGGGVDQGIFKHRKDIPEPIRNVLGEYKDPAELFIMTVARMAAARGQALYLHSVFDAGIGKIFFAKNDGSRDPRATMQISSHENLAWSPLNGLYTTPEVYEYMKQAWQANGPVATLYNKVTAIVKMGKTVYSPVTQSINALSNTMWYLANGYFLRNPVDQAGQIGGAIKFWAQNIANTEGALDRWNEKMVKLGLYDGSVGLNDIRRLFAAGDIDQIMNAAQNLTASNWVGKVKKLASDNVIIRNYQLSDAVSKFIAFRAEAGSLAWAIYDKEYNNLTPEETDAIDKRAAERVKNTQPTGQRAYQGALWLSKNGLVFGNFITFQAESIRCARNVIAYAVKDMADSNPRIKALGARRIVGIASYLTARGMILAALAQVSNLALSGIYGMFDDDDEEKKKRLAALNALGRPFMRSQDKFAVQKEDGTYDVYNLNALDPFGVVFKVPNAFTGGSEHVPEPGVMAAASELIGPFIEPDMIVETIGRVFIQEETATGQPLDTPGKKIAEIFHALGPSAIPFIQRMFRHEQDGSMADWKEILTDPKSLEFEFNGAQMFGFRPYKVDPLRSFKKQVFAELDNAAKISYEGYDVRRKAAAGTISDSDLTAEMDAVNQKNIDLGKKLKELKGHATALGVPEDECDRIIYMARQMKTFNPQTKYEALK